ncbi:hypothetical protein JB92DRAFT_1894482 [Gautieria morchelliformis]|nr:hypothetical protein JB92DRAFT_1894482 [Gautieria morchelliformis]
MEYTQSHSYQNEEERNVHVWASRRTPKDRFLVLTAGCNTFEKLPIHTFYQWLDVILAKPNGLPTSVWMIAGPMSKDPRDGGLPTTPPPRESSVVLPRTSTDTIKPGHYGIFYYYQS